MTNTLVSENMKSVICKDWVMNKRWPPFHSGFPGLNMIIHIYISAILSRILGFTAMAISYQQLLLCMVF